MILRIEMVRVREKIQAIKLLRTLGKIGLKEAKELVETLQTPSPAEVAADRYRAADISLSGTIRVKVDPVFALGNLVAALNAGLNHNPLPTGVQVFPEPNPLVVDIS